MHRPTWLACAMLLGAALPALAQTAAAWDEPSFRSPVPADDIGIYSFRPDRGDYGFVGMWRQSGNVNLGVRAGIGGHVLDARLIIVGAELDAPLALLGPASPVLLAWTAGIGATFNGVTTLRVPVGVSAGVRLPLAGDLVAVPYVHPRVAFDLISWTVADEEQTETEFNVPVDVGADLHIGTSFVIRFGLSIATVNTVGAGIALRIPRRVEVR